MSAAIAEACVNVQNVAKESSAMLYSGYFWLASSNSSPLFEHVLQWILGWGVGGNTAQE